MTTRFLRYKRELRILMSSLEVMVKRPDCRQKLLIATLSAAFVFYENWYTSHMIISYHGMDFFKVSFGDTTIAVNPISKDSKFKSTKFGSDITLVSLNSPEHNGVDITSRGEKESFLIKGPGEYEVSGVFIKGFLSYSNYSCPEQAGSKQRRI